jgi:hypothetical protein
MMQAEALSLEKSMDAAAADPEIKEADTDKEPDSESTADEAAEEGEVGVDT